MLAFSKTILMLRLYSLFICMGPTNHNWEGEGGGRKNSAKKYHTWKTHGRSHIQKTQRLKGKSVKVFHIKIYFGYRKISFKKIKELAMCWRERCGNYLFPFIVSFQLFYSVCSLIEQREGNSINLEVLSKTNVCRFLSLETKPFIVFSRSRRLNLVSLRNTWSFQIQ